MTGISNIDERFTIETIERAKAGDMEAAEEALRLFCEAVDHRLQKGIARADHLLLEHFADCFRRYLDGTRIELALGLDRQRKAGQPKGTRKVNEDSYAALIVLLQRRLGSADKAKRKVLELESVATRIGKAPISKRSLDTIYAICVGTRSLDDEVLMAMLSPHHRKVFADSLR